MAIKVIMPKIGQTMVEGTLVEWAMKDGEPATRNMVIAEAESNKIPFEIKAPGNGILRIIAEAGQDYRIGTIIGYITEAGEAVPQEDDEDLVLAKTAAAQEKKVPVGKDEVLATPIARRVAKEKGVDLAQVSGSGPGGRITDRDVLEFIVAQSAASPAAVDIPCQGSKKTLPFTGTRATIAKRMHQSLQTTAQATAMAELDLTETVHFYQQWKEAYHLTFTDLFIKAAIAALKAHPIVNSRLVGDEIQLLNDIHIGIAVAVKDGLVVPVLHHADRLSLAEIAEQVSQLVQKARSGDLEPDDLSGSTFTLTNMGMYGVDFGTPILNPPEVAILSIGRIKEKPVAHQGNLQFRSVAGFSLTFDHQVMDGVPAAQFLQTLGELFANPDGFK